MNSLRKLVTNYIKEYNNSRLVKKGEKPLFQFNSNRVSMDPYSDVQITDLTFAQKDLVFALVVDVLNMSSKIITEIKIEVVFINALGKFIFDKTVFSHTFTDLNIPSNEIFYLEPWELDERHQTARSALVRIAELHFSDGSRKYFNVKRENVYTLPILPKEKSEKIQALFGNDVITYGNKIKDAWRCVCGAINPFEYTECRHCQRNRDFILATLTERIINEKLFSIIQKDQEEDLNPDYLSHQSSQHVEDIKEIQAKRKGGKSEDEQTTSMSLKRRIFLVLASLLALVFLINTGIFLYKKMDTRNTLKTAETYIHTGKYKEALELYKSLSPEIDDVDVVLKIEDTKNLIKSEDDYSKGVELTIENNTLGALFCFTKVLPEDRQNYLKSQAMITSLKQDYIRGIENQMAEGQWEEALKKIEDLISILPEEQGLKDIRIEILEQMGN